MNDLEFVQKCVDKDTRAWDEFVDKYSRLVYKYIHSVLKSKGLYRLSQDAINDLFQDIFLLLIKDNCRKLRSFKAKNGCSLASWLRQVVINFTIDYTRALRPLVSLDAEEEGQRALYETIADDSPSALAAITDKERLADLRDCVARLNTDDKYFLELHFYRGLTLEEARAVLRLSRGAIDMRKARIVRWLKRCFQGKGFALDS